MNVPLKKRHTYCGINGDVASIDATATRKSGSIKCDYVENEEHEHPSICIEIDDELSATKSLNAAICSILPTSGKTPKNTKMQQQPSQQQYLGNFAENNLTNSIDVMESNVKMLEKMPSPELVTPPKQPIDKKAMKMMGGTPPSNAVTSSASNNTSFTPSLRRGEESSSDSSSCSDSCSHSSRSVSIDFRFHKNLPHRLLAGGGGRSPVRVTLTEACVKLNELQHPPLTTHERVLYWKIADEFSDIENDFDDAMYSMKPIRSERLQKLMYKKPIPQEPIIATPKKAKSTISRVTKAKTCRAKSTKAKSVRAKSVRAKSVRARSERAKSLRARSTKAKSTRAKSTRAKTTKAKSVKTSKSTKSKKEKTPAPQPFMFDRDRYLQERLQQRLQQQRQQQLQHASNISSNRIVIATNPEIPSAIKLRVNYNKDLNTSALSMKSSENFKAPTTPLMTNAKDASFCSGCQTDLSIGNVKSSREEFYSYLGIDTNPVPETQKSPESSHADTSLSSAQRRSLRVFIQQKQIESITKSNERLNRSLGDLTSNSKSVVANSFSAQMSSSFLKNPKCDEPNQPTAHKTVRRLSNEFNAMLDNNKIRKLSTAQNGFRDFSLNMSWPWNIPKFNANSIAPPLRSVEKISNNQKSLIMQRRSYEPRASHDAAYNKQNVYNCKVLSSPQSPESKINERRPTMMFNGRTINQTQETDTNRNSQMRSTATYDVKQSSTLCPVKKETAKRRTKVIKRRIIRMPNALTLAEMFKRYRQCLRQEKSQKTQRPLGKRMKKRKALRPIVNVQSIAETKQTIKSNGNEASKVVYRTTECEPSTSTTVSQQLNKVENDLNVIASTTNKRDEKCSIFPPPCEEPTNAFSPNSITHSNASTDSAIVLHNLNEPARPVNVAVTTLKSLQWRQDQTKSINKSEFVSPLSSRNGQVLAILTHTLSPDHNETIVVIQELMVSFWCSPSKVLRMFGEPQSWQMIGQIGRLVRDSELNCLHQYRLINIGELFPIYVEMRTRESKSDGARQCCLSSTYVNVYAMKPDAENRPQLRVHSVHLDTIKGFADSIKYIALKNSPEVLMTWTEQGLLQNRSGIIKYTIKTPSLDGIEEIMDFPHIQNELKSLYEVNDYHFVGCGDRTISMWDHRNGNLLIDFEIDIPTIGRNLGCYTLGSDNPQYMLLVQLMPVQQGDVTVSAGCKNQLKVIASQTVDPYNWRTLQTHNVPDNFGGISAVFSTGDMLTILFTSGCIILLNISSPQTIYVRNQTSTTKAAKPPALFNGLGNQSNGQIKPNNEKVSTPRLFAQSNGQIIEISGDRVLTKSVMEYFIERQH